MNGLKYTKDANQVVKTKYEGLAGEAKLTLTDAASIFSHDKPVRVNSYGCKS